MGSDSSLLLLVYFSTKVTVSDAIFFSLLLPYYQMGSGESFLMSLSEGLTLTSLR